MRRRYHIGKLAAVLKLRIKELGGGRGTIGLENMKSLKAYMKKIIITDAVFPINNIDADAILGVPPIEDTLGPQQEYEDYEDEDEEVVMGGGRSSGGGRLSNSGGRLAAATSGTLLGRPTNMKPGERFLTIVVEKWGFKEIPYFTEPQVVISVRSQNGEVIESIQETPYGKKNSGTGAASSPNYVYFENAVKIQTPLNKMGSGTIRRIRSIRASNATALWRWMRSALARSHWRSTRSPPFLTPRFRTTCCLSSLTSSAISIFL